MTATRCADKFYENRGNQPLLDLLDLSRPGFALDCGCGAGDNAAILHHHGWRVTGITISPSEKEAAERYCEAVYIHDLEAGLPAELAGPYDLILMSHVLEHLVHPQHLLDAAKRVLAPDGHLLVALPNVLQFRQRLRFLFGKFEYESTGLMDNTHVRFYTFDTGRRLLEQNGIDVVTAKADGAAPLWKLRSLLPSRMIRAIDRLASRWWPNVFGWQSLYLGRRRA